jgi:hypothetical protein
MKKVIVYSKPVNFWYRVPDVEHLNKEIAEIENDGWSIVSVSANTNFFGVIVSYTVLVESS